MARTYAEQLTLARTALANGFTTKTAQKDAAFFVSCAFDQVRDDFRKIGFDECGNTRWYEMPVAWRELHDSMPYTPAHWNAKRAAKFTAYPAIVARANECAALRVEIMAAPVVKPTTRPRTIKQQAEDAKRRTCQICARQIFAEVGVIAHHGYERPGDGMQTASCYGARALPFEASKSVLETYIGLLVNELAGMVETQRRTDAEEIPVRVSYKWNPTDDRGRYVYEAGRMKVAHGFFIITDATTTDMVEAHPNYFTRDILTEYPNWDEIFPALKRKDLARRAAMIVTRREYLAAQRKRAAGWKQKEQWNTETSKWETV